MSSNKVVKELTSAPFFLGIFFSVLLSCPLSVRKQVFLPVVSNSELKVAEDSSLLVLSYCSNISNKLILRSALVLWILIFFYSLLLKVTSSLYLSKLSKSSSGDIFSRNSVVEISSYKQQFPVDTISYY